MNDQPHDSSSKAEPDWRQRFVKADHSLPTSRVRAAKKATPAWTAAAGPPATLPAHSGSGILVGQGDTAPAVAGRTRPANTFWERAKRRSSSSSRPSSMKPYGPKTCR